MTMRLGGAPATEMMLWGPPAGDAPPPRLRATPQPLHPSHSCNIDKVSKEMLLTLEADYYPSCVKHAMHAIMNRNRRYNRYPWLTTVLRLHHDETGNVSTRIRH